MTTTLIQRMLNSGLCAVVLTGCAILEPVKMQRFGDISAYKYVIIGETGIVSSSVGSGFGFAQGGIGYAGSGSVSKSLNPADIIAGILMNKGYIVIDSSANKDNVLLVKYGQGDKRNVLGGLGGYTLGVSIQILDFHTKEPLFTCQAEGQGSTEADDIRKAITRCLEGFYPFVALET